MVGLRYDEEPWLAERPPSALRLGLSRGERNGDWATPMQQSLSILVFAYVFPPDAGSGTYRTLYFANNWAKQGDEVTIVTVSEACFVASASIDRELCSEIHPRIRLVRASAMRPLQLLLDLREGWRRKTGGPVRAMSRDNEGLSPTKAGARPGRGGLRRFTDAITDLLSCPDEHVGWVPDAVRRGYRIAKSRSVDVIYATGGPWSGLIAAAILHKLCGVRLLLDFRDPWVSNPNLAGKSPFSRWLQRKMEAVCVRMSSTVIANTERLRQDFLARYPKLDASRFTTVTNGFEHLLSSRSRSDGCFTLVHAGTLYTSRNPLNLLRAIVALVKSGAIPPDRFRVQLVGGLSIANQEIQSELRSELLKNVVAITPRVSHDHVLSIQAEASALLLIQIGFPLQVPRKLYEYMSLSLPVLAIAETGSATANMVKELDLGYVAEDSVQSIKAAILVLYEDWKSGRSRCVNPGRLHQYENSYLSNRVREIMLKG